MLGRHGCAIRNKSTSSGLDVKTAMLTSACPQKVPCGHVKFLKGAETQATPWQVGSGPPHCRPRAPEIETMSSTPQGTQRSRHDEALPVSISGGQPAATDGEAMLSLLRDCQPCNRGAVCILQEGLLPRRSNIAADLWTTSVTVQMTGQDQGLHPPVLSSL